MLVERINPNSPQQSVIDRASSLIAQGAVVVFPSDSSYGLAVDPTNKKAVRRLFAIKGRSHENQISCIFPSLDFIELWAAVTPRQERILEHNLPGPFTFLLQPTTAYPLMGDSVGVRIPNNTITQILATTLAQPYTATSANISGQPAAYSVDEVTKQFAGETVRPDLILDAGQLPHHLSSTVVDIRSDLPKVIRQGGGNLLLPT